MPPATPPAWAIYQPSITGHRHPRETCEKWTTGAAAGVQRGPPQFHHLLCCGRSWSAKSAQSVMTPKCPLSSLWQKSTDESFRHEARFSMLSAEVREFFGKFKLTLTGSVPSTPIFIPKNQFVCSPRSNSPPTVHPTGGNGWQYLHRHPWPRQICFLPRSFVPV